MLHGRLAFEDPRRELVRLLVWLREPFAREERLVARARAAAERAAAGRHASPEADLSEAGLASPRLGLVLELLRGTPPGVVEKRSGVREADLYAMRDAALRGALEALEGDPRVVTPGG
jgi:hypothetical protein